MTWVRGHRRRTGFLGSTWVRSHFRRNPVGYRRGYRRYGGGYRRYGGRVSWLPLVIGILLIVVLIAIF